MIIDGVILVIFVIIWVVLHFKAHSTINTRHEMRDKIREIAVDMISEPKKGRGRPRKKRGRPKKKRGKPRKRKKKPKAETIASL